jgi:uncharacterized membrane protein
MINKHLPIFLLTGTVVLLLDGVFIYGIKDYFNKQIKLVQGTDIVPDYLAIILTYLVIIFGLYYFIIREKKSVMDAALLGFAMYALYELTTKSLLKNWKWKTVIMDTTWGVILYSLATFIVYKLLY